MKDWTCLHGKSDCNKIIRTVLAIEVRLVIGRILAVCHEVILLSISRATPWTRLTPDGGLF